MTNENDMKFELLEKIDGGLDFFKFVIPDLEQVDEYKCRPVLNPFYDDTNPSLNIYYSDNSERWMFYDHGDSTFSGDVFDFAALYFDLDVISDFRKLIRSISEALSVELESGNNYYEPDYDLGELDEYGNKKFSEAYSLKFDLFPKGNERIELAYSYLGKYKITKEILQEYNVQGVTKYSYLKNGKLSQAKMPPGRLLIAYDDSKFAKLYQPEPKKFWYLGDKPEDYVFGKTQLINRVRKSKVYNCIDPL